MKNNILSSVWNWVSNIFRRKEKHLTDEVSELPMFSKTKRPGRGAYFTNNRKSTRGRNIQYVSLPNGRTKLIRHETI